MMERYWEVQSLRYLRVVIIILPFILKSRRFGKTTKCNMMMQEKDSLFLCSNHGVTISSFLLLLMALCLCSLC